MTKQLPSREVFEEAFLSAYEEEELFPMGRRLAALDDDVIEEALDAAEIYKTVDGLELDVGELFDFLTALIDIEGGRPVVEGVLECLGL